MRDDADTIEEFDRDGFAVTVAIVADDDYELGRDDDVYPELQYGLLPEITCPDCEGNGYENGDDETTTDCPRCSGTGEIEDEAGVDGWGEAPSWYREPWHVTGEALRELAELNGATVETLREDARKIARGDIRVYGVMVTARRGNIEGHADLWGIKVDHSDRSGHAMDYPREVARDELAPEAIEQAARKVAGNLAPLALSY